MTALWLRLRCALGLHRWAASVELDLPGAAAAAGPLRMRRRCVLCGRRSRWRELGDDGRWS